MGVALELIATCHENCVVNHYDCGDSYINVNDDYANCRVQISIATCIVKLNTVHVMTYIYHK